LATEDVDLWCATDYTMLQLMRLYVGVTDNDWFAFLASKTEVEEVNFWRPSPNVTFKVLAPGELLLFKLHAPENFIAGGGFFTRFLQLPVNMAWDTFGEANGLRSLIEMRERIGHYRRNSIALNENPTVGCIMLAESFFGTAPNGFRAHRSLRPTRRRARASIPRAVLAGFFGKPYPNDCG
jgi:hypothetical protein